jgi:hypothetical protein
MEVLDWPLSKMLTYAECLSNGQEKDVEQPERNFEELIQDLPDDSLGESYSTGRSNI